MLYKLAQLVEEYTDVLMQLEVLDNGMSLHLAKCQASNKGKHFYHLAGWATKIQGETNDVSPPGNWHVSLELGGESPHIIFAG